MLEVDNFDDLMKEKTLIVEFTGCQCIQCKMSAPVMEEIAEELKDKAIFVKCNVEKNANYIQKYNLMSLPTMLIFVNGKLVCIKSGPELIRPKKILKEWILSNI